MKKMRLKLVPATLEMARQLANTMRDSDVEEILAVGYAAPFDALVIGLDSKEPTMAAIDAETGEVHAFFACNQVDAGLACPWMLCSHTMHTYRKELLLLAIPVVEKWSESARLFNYVHAENVRAIAWLKRLGFKIHPAVRYGLKQQYFHPFTK